MTVPSRSSSEAGDNPTENVVANHVNVNGIASTLSVAGAMSGVLEVIDPTSSAESADDARGNVVSPMQGTDDNDIPSFYVCPYILDPPVQVVYFDVPGSDGQISPQVFEYSQLYRDITILGRITPFQSIRHSLNGGWICHDQALALVHPVSA